MPDQTPEAEIARRHIARIDRELQGIEAMVNIAWDACAFDTVASFGSKVEALNAERKVFAALLSQPEKERDADE